jgi:methionyl-tRNA formyltransferase
MPKFAFFGSSMFSVFLLNSLKEKGWLPALIISTPDKPQGRKLVLTPTPVSVWAKENNISLIAPASLKVEIPELHGFDLFIVASYGKIIPQAILDMPKDGVLNVHPSMLPKYRGPSPIQSAMLDDDKNTGVTIMLLDALMDHGPIIAQEKIEIKEWLPLLDMKKVLAEKGAALLVENFKNTPVEQNHDLATYTKKITKEDGLIDFTSDPYLNYRKFLAFSGWPSVYYFVDNVRVKITKARFEKQAFVIKKIIPEGKSEIDFNEHYRPRS